MSAARDRRLVLVFGVGRSGTSLITGILGQVGFHVPQPEIKADETNPRGFGEPQWVVEFHQRLMRKLRVTVFDARPAAWEITARVAADAALQAELREWLGGQLDEADAVVVKDPRIGWFLPLWTAGTAALGVPQSHLVMLRHPAEILASARRWYGDWQTDASRAAAWVNVMLETERATRGERRVFVRYEDLLSDWLGQVDRIGTALDQPLLAGLDHERLARVGEFVDPSLRRSRVGWDELDVPAPVRDMADDVWGRLQRLADQDGDEDGARGGLDGARAAYDTLYREAEAIAQSSVTAVKPRRRAGARTAAPPSLRVRLARRVPERYRRRLRRAAGSLRRSG
jgi:hypothetical protein